MIHDPSVDIPGSCFYLSGPQEFADGLETPSEVVMNYRWCSRVKRRKDGKLPGVYYLFTLEVSYLSREYSCISSEITLLVVGGTGELCSEGKKDHCCQCFDLRLMWRWLVMCTSFFREDLRVIELTSFGLEQVLWQNSTFSICLWVSDAGEFKGLKCVLPCSYENNDRIIQNVDYCTVEDNQRHQNFYWLNQNFLRQTKFRFGFRELKNVRKTTFEVFPTRFWVGQNFWAKKWIVCTPFGLSGLLFRATFRVPNVSLSTQAPSSPPGKHFDAVSAYQHLHLFCKILVIPDIQLHLIIKIRTRRHCIPLFQVDPCAVR